MRGHRSGPDQSPMRSIDWESARNELIHRLEPHETPSGLTASQLWDWLEEHDFSSAHIDQAVRCDIVKVDGTCYQDGPSLQEQELTWFRASRVGLLHSIVKHGLAPLIPAHGTEGLCVFGCISDETYQGGANLLECTEGCKAPRYLPEQRSPYTPTQAVRGMQCNRRTRSDGAQGYLEWVATGQHLNCALPIRITALLIRQSSEIEATFSSSLTSIIKKLCNVGLGSFFGDVWADLDNSSA